MRREQTFVGWVEGRSTAEETVNTTILAMKSCVRAENRPVQYAVTAQLTEGTVTKRSVFFCGGTEHELAKMMAMGGTAALRYGEVERRGGTSRKCKLSIVLETVEPPTDMVFMPEYPACCI